VDTKDLDRFEILRQLALAGAQGGEIQPTAELALRQAASLVGLKAASVYLWNASDQISLTVSYADTDLSRDTLASLEQTLFANLRRDRRLLSAYMTFSGTPMIQAFTQPLQHAGKMYGAVIGIQEGERKLISEDLFLEALSAALSLNIVAGEVGKSHKLAKETIDRERFGAIQQTAVTVNHEINNPLTAILGNVQLLLMKRTDLDEELVTKLKTIEISALKIRDVTQKLLRLTTPRSVEYSEGTQMIDLSDSDQSSND
jgi:signal transduction histidine kinase